MLPDILTPDLMVVIVGTSAATVSANRGHYYAGPGNQFWTLLATSGLIGHRRLGPDDDQTLPGCGVGLTDLVKTRASSSDANLVRNDYDVSGLVAKITHVSPRIVAFNGLTAAGVAGRALRHGKPPLGLAPWTIGTSAVFVLPSSSAAACDPAIWAPHTTKAHWWLELGELARMCGEGDGHD
ncbi:MAG TPA: mismatch-specific DNA-glycosylase [Actinomycetota bacterium]|nr:mismatch-specific DNA-glycosylase [Actinomycetota bacterium]